MKKPGKNATPQELAEYYLEPAKTSMSEGNYDVAEIFLRNLSIQQLSDAFNTAHLRAANFCLRGDYSRAVELIDSSLSVYENDPDAPISILFDARHSVEKTAAKYGVIIEPRIPKDPKYDRSQGLE